MSFNLNKLVQPECGGPNPLVAAAQQISNLSAPSTSTAVSQISRFGKFSTPIDFASEFMKSCTTQATCSNDIPSQLHLPPSVSTSATTANRFLAQNAGSYMTRPTAFMPAQSSNHMGYMMQQSQQPSQTSAGDQLEEKYRNDMLKVTQKQPVNQDLDTSKVDDVEFWQSLSQKYLGPTTFDNNIQREKPFFNYIFDEKNPLKDEYEDPFSEGLKRLEQGDIPSAALLFEAAVQNQPENSEAWRYLGTTQAQNEKDMSAIQALRNCLNVNNQDQEARLAIAVSLANEMHHHEACKHLLDWLVNHEKYRQLGASVEEFKELDSELSDDPFYINAVDQKHYRYVRDKFVDAARMSPNNPDAEVQSSLGVLFNMRGEYEKAVDCFKAALSVKSNDSLLWNRLGATLANGSKPDEAVIAYRKALEISPGFLRSRYNLAISLIHLNIYDEAAKQLVQILKMQAAGRGSKNVQVRSRSITSTAIWNTLRTVATLLNKPDLYPIIDGRDLQRCEEEIFKIAEEARCLRPR